MRKQLGDTVGKSSSEPNVGGPGWTNERHSLFYRQLKKSLNKDIKNGAECSVDW